MTIGRELNKLSRLEYKAARTTRDLNAITRGPGAVAKRVVRRRLYRGVNGGLAKLIKGFGL